MTLVKEFHDVFGHPAPSSPPLWPDEQTLQLRLRLIAEEFEEVRVEFSRLIALKRAGASPQNYIPIYRNLLKELADLRYVTDGAAVALGLPIDEAFQEVHASNMSKLGEDGKPIVRADGKVLKGPQYREANMDRFVEDIIEHKE